jgi:hypothetical protein
MQARSNAACGASVIEAKGMNASAGRWAACLSVGLSGIADGGRGRRSTLAVPVGRHGAGGPILAAGPRVGDPESPIFRAQKTISEKRSARWHGQRAQLSILEIPYVMRK